MENKKHTPGGASINDLDNMTTAQGYDNLALVQDEDNYISNAFSKC